MVQNHKNAFSFLFAVFSLLVPLSLPACAKKVSWQARVIDMPYYEARKIILNNGWTPAQTERSDFDAEYGLPHFYYDAEYTEVLACSGTGMGYCTFKFHNEKGEYLKVTTQGGDYSPDDEHPPTVIYIGVSEDFQ